MDDFATILGLAAKGGGVLLPFVLWLWWSERTDRIKAQDLLIAQAKEDRDEIVALAKEATGAIRDTGGAVDRITDGAGETRASLAKIAESVTILASRRR